MLLLTLVDWIVKRHKCLPFFCLLPNHQLEKTSPFFLCKTHQAAAPCVFGCLSAQHEIYALLAPFSDKSTALIAITESEGDLITLPTSRQHWLPSIWRLFCYIITAAIAAITMFHKLEMCADGSLVNFVILYIYIYIFSYLRYHLNSFHFIFSFFIPAVLYSRYNKNIYRITSFIIQNLESLMGHEL